ncbi:hypothetical protein D3C76_428440 [compost metagenome]
MDIHIRPSLFVVHSYFVTRQCSGWFPRCYRASVIRIIAFVKEVVLLTITIPDVAAIVEAGLQTGRGSEVNRILDVTGELGCDCF